MRYSIKTHRVVNCWRVDVTGSCCAIVFRRTACMSAFCARAAARRVRATGGTRISTWAPLLSCKLTGNDPVEYNVWFCFKGLKWNLATNAFTMQLIVHDTRFVSFTTESVYDCFTGGWWTHVTTTVRRGWINCATSGQSTGATPSWTAPRPVPRYYSVTSLQCFSARFSTSEYHLSMLNRKFSIIVSCMCIHVWNIIWFMCIGFESGRGHCWTETDLDGPRVEGNSQAGCYAVTFSNTNTL